MKSVRFLAFLLSMTAVFAASYSREGKLWWAHVVYLADDRLQGRDTGSEGYLEAARYVVAQFRGLGLQPGGTDGYYQPVKFETRTLDRGRSSVTLIRNGVRVPLKLGADVNLNATADMPELFSAPMVFAGYGLTIPGSATLRPDVRGKIVVYFNADGPPVGSGPDARNVQAFYASPGERWRALRAAGAVGIATLANPRTDFAPEGAAPPPPPPPAVVLADPALQDSAGQSISLSISRGGADRFFAGSGHAFQDLRESALGEYPLTEFPLAVTLEASAVVKRAPMESPNVVAILPGADPKLKEEYVVISAHLDHVGIGPAVEGDRIYNGAMDNAAGVASVIEIARLFREARTKPRRSILFLILTGEEKGLLGSKYFVAHPTVPIRQIVADVNLDAFLPLYKLKELEVEGLAESTLGDKIRAAAGQAGVTVQTDREPEQNRFIRSDHFSFVHEGIPALAFKFGYEYGSKEETIRLGWWDQHYHRPSDDTAHPVDEEAAAKFNHVIFSLLQSVADDPARPSWETDSFFRQFSK